MHACVSEFALLALLHATILPLPSMRWLLSVGAYRSGGKKLGAYQLLISRYALNKQQIGGAIHRA